jgi:RND family efflux transporter MFP subunit
VTSPDSQEKVEPAQSPTDRAPSHSQIKSSFVVPVVIGCVVLFLLGLLLAMRHHADSLTNKVALTDAAKPVTVIKAKDAFFQATRTYVGTLEPWVESKVGPQFVSAYVSTVLVRPGAQVKKGSVLATLDCRSASATAQSIEMQARSLDTQQKALADEAARVTNMLDGGFVSPTEVEDRSAQSEAKQAELLATKAKLLDTSLQVSDCVLRAPFDGEVASRWLDPGAFVRPGQAIVSVVDRSTVRFVADVPESDFDVVYEGKSGTLSVFAGAGQLTAAVSRRAPAADPETRTVHIEVDLTNPNRRIPVYTTGEFQVGVGDPVPSIELPLVSATVRGKKATVFTVENDVAHVRPLVYQGEQGSSIFVDTSLPAGTLVVTEGRTLLSDGDHVAYKLEGAASTTHPTSHPAPSNGSTTATSQAAAAVNTTAQAKP